VQTIPKSELGNGWLEINPKLHHEYVEVSVDAIGYQAMIWHKSMFSSPCKCCAAKDHGLLKLIDMGNGKKISTFDCPVTCRENVVDLINEEQVNRKYMPCPERFAYHFGCQEEAVRTALRSFDDQGAGKYLDGREFVEFSTRAINTCTWYRSMNTFKREMTPDYQYAEEALQSDPEEDDPQDNRA
jgi:hypothetical protein